LISDTMLKIKGCGFPILNLPAWHQKCEKGEKLLAGTLLAIHPVNSSLESCRPTQCTMALVELRRQQRPRPSLDRGL